jgi:endoglucanase
MNTNQQESRRGGPSFRSLGEDVRRSANIILALNSALFTLFLVAGVSASAEGQTPAAAPHKGQVIFETSFESNPALQGWEGRADPGPGYKSDRSLLIARQPEAASSAASVRRSLPVETLRGCTIRATAMVKAADVTEKPKPWNGIKFMLAIEAPSGRLWPQADAGTGNFDWKPVAFSARIPADATAVVLYLGLEEVNGKTWFDDVKLTVAKPPIVPPTVAATGPVFKGHDRPRLRGAMISPSIDADSLRVLGKEWNANLIRWQLIRMERPGQPSSLESFNSWLEAELKKLEAALPYCEQYGLKVVVDLHSPPGGKATVSGYVGSDDRLFTDPTCQTRFVETWERIARRFKNSKAIWGYDLANEPVEDLVEEGCDDWQGLAERTARAIRAVDPDRAIIVEPAAWGGPAGLNDLVPLSVANVVYSVHMYIPHAFTHQGVHQSGPSYTYPGVIEGKTWNKGQLELALQPVIKFQKQYNVHIYIGEFSAIRWAPDRSACRYLSDLIDIFEAHGWDWSYHAFREWSGWSVEHGPDRQDTRPSSTPTDRQQLLLQWFARNQKHAVSEQP